VRNKKRKKIEDRKKPQGKNIMSAYATQGGHNQCLESAGMASGRASGLQKFEYRGDHISSLCKSHYYHIYQLCCICLYLNSTTACTIATSIIHSKLDYCNFLDYKFPKSQITSLKQIQNSFACTVVKAPLLALLPQNN